MSEKERNEIKDSIMKHIESMDEERLKSVLYFLDKMQKQKEQAREVD